MTESAGIARLWQGFHHLSESDKDLVLAVAETIDQEQSGAFYKGEHCHSGIKDRALTPVGGIENGVIKEF